jgi:1-hydroxycarotenoid 3,4-desaturase
VADDRVVIVGAGIGGLASAIDLATMGLGVTVIERAKHAGGKMREVAVGDAPIDCGPTVFTMRWVFDELFANADAAIEDYLRLTPLQTLARHAWSERERFDLFADSARTADAVAEFSGPEEGRRFLGFCADARTIYRTLKDPFLSSSRPNPLTLACRIGLHRSSALFGIRPFETMWSALSKYFHDPRLRQLFGRYATYAGSSPFAAPATLMLIAHVEQDGVWTIEGGMQRLTEALEKLARKKGVSFRFGEDVRQIIIRNRSATAVELASGERIDAGAVIVNADAAALADGAFGHAAAHAGKSLPPNDRSLSAVTWAMTAETQGFELLRHNVFFSHDYAAEFDDIFERRRLPRGPTVYICAQDRLDAASRTGPERLLMLVNAPPIGDQKQFMPEEIAACESHVFNLLERCGLLILARQVSVTTPSDFHRMFPATGGALYGRASHGWTAAFRRAASRTNIAGLYLASGSTHPGAGVPMAALSGRLAAMRLVSDRASIRRSLLAGMPGGISTASATTDALRSR